MKTFPVHKHLSKTPILFGLPMSAGGLFFGLSIGNAILFLLMTIHPLIKVGAIVALPLLVYLVMHTFFSSFSIGSFSKVIFSKKIVTIRHKSINPFKLI